MLSSEEIEKRFARPRNSNARLEIVARSFKHLAYMVNELVPSGREAALMFTALDEAMIWAEKSLERNPEAKAVPYTSTYRAEITMGMKEGYDGEIHTWEEVIRICKAYCDEVKLGLEVHFGKCVYVNGDEPCARISLINYPRFPSTPEMIFIQATVLGKRLAKEFKQQRFTIVATDKTQMFEVEACTSAKDS